MLKVEVEDSLVDLGDDEADLDSVRSRFAEFALRRDKACESGEKEHGDDVWKRGCYLLKPLLLSILSYHPRYILFHMRQRISLCTC